MAEWIYPMTQTSNDSLRFLREREVRPFIKVQGSGRNFEEERGRQKIF
ncbi:hypothetical protein [Peribacillus saganii]|nr:hypothetical protein [Peribacillus saganii]